MFSVVCFMVLASIVFFYHHLKNRRVSAVIFAQISMLMGAIGMAATKCFQIRYLKDIND